MTTHVSRERREAIAKAMYLRDYAAVEASPGEASETWDRYTDMSGIRARFLAMADAAIQTMLPDQNAFGDALDAYYDAVVAFALAGEGWDVSATEQAEDQRDAAMLHLFALVFGADDAQAGDQEGAEHDGVGDWTARAVASIR